MDIDINQLLADMLDAIKGVVKDKWTLVKDNAESFLQDKKDRLELLVNMRLANEIQEDFFQNRLNDEKVILESELLSLKIIGESIIQQAANAAIDVLIKAVEAALKI
jgi:hypothetical protein